MSSHDYIIWLFTNHAIWVGLAGLLHATAGYIVVDRFTPYPPVYGFIGGLLPDLIDGWWIVFDWGFPFVHRGIVHTPFGLAILLFLFWMLEWEAAYWGIGLGFFMHLVYDTMSGWGVIWLYPFSQEFVHIDWGFNEMGNLIMIVGITVLVIFSLPKKRRLHRTT